MARGLGVLRVLIALNAVAIFAQAVFAGMFLGGDATMRAVHGMGSFAVHALGLLLLIAAIVHWRPWHGPGFPALASTILLFAGFAQSMTGGSGVTAVHVPLGMAMFGLVIWLVVWALRRR